jgi:hypothetical protein
MLEKFRTILFHQKSFTCYRVLHSDGLTDMGKRTGAFLQLFIANAKELILNFRNIRKLTSAICRPTTYFTQINNGNNGVYDLWQ